MEDDRKLKVMIDYKPGKPIEDPRATTSCPKYSFKQVEISTICTKCEHFHGVKRAAGIGETKQRSKDWHNENAVTCAYPLQRRIYPLPEIIRG